MVNTDQGWGWELGLGTENEKKGQTGRRVAGVAGLGAYVPLGIEDRTSTWALSLRMQLWQGAAGPWG